MLLLSGLTADFHTLVALRTFGGAATAFAFILGASLATAVAASPERASLTVALYIAGASGGVVVSGLVLPPLLAALGAPGWRAGWLAMGALALAAVIPAGLAVRHVAAAGLRQPGRLPLAVVRRLLLPTFASYALFGGGYVSYMTFIIVLVRQAGGGPWATSGYWVLLGLSSIAGTLLWGRLLGAVRAGGRTGLRRASRRGTAGAAVARTSGGLRLGGAVRRQLHVRADGDHHAGPPPAGAGAGNCRHRRADRGLRAGAGAGSDRLGLRQRPHRVDRGRALGGAAASGGLRCILFAATTDREFPVVMSHRRLS